jgi:hypothetical protein
VRVLPVSHLYVEVCDCVVRFRAGVIKLWRLLSPAMDSRLVYQSKKKKVSTTSPNGQGKEQRLSSQAAYQGRRLGS